MRREEGMTPVMQDQLNLQQGELSTPAFLSHSVDIGSRVRAGAARDRYRCVALDRVDAPAPDETKVNISDEVNYENDPYGGVEHACA
jgi:hypothetical protein